MLVSADVSQVTAPGTAGELGILPEHVTFLGQMDTGVVSYDEAGKRTKVVVRGGYVEVVGDVVTILADDAEFAAETDAAAARADAARIREELRRSEHALTSFVEQDDRRPRGRESSRLFGRMVEYARLEGAQQAQIAVECALLRTRVQRQHLAARAAFLDMLDGRQRRMLDSIETQDSLRLRSVLTESYS